MAKYRIYLMLYRLNIIRLAGSMGDVVPSYVEWLQIK